jgi:hypothetical protein
VTQVFVKAAKAAPAGVVVPIVVLRSAVSFACLVVLPSAVPATTVNTVVRAQDTAIRAQGCSATIRLPMQTSRRMRMLVTARLGQHRDTECRSQFLRLLLCDIHITTATERRPVG